MPVKKLKEKYIMSMPMGPESRPSIRIDLKDKDLEVLSMVEVNEEVQLIIRGKVTGMQNDTSKEAGVVGSLTIENLSLELITPSELERLLEEDD